MYTIPNHGDNGHGRLLIINDISDNGDNGDGRPVIGIIISMISTSVATGNWYIITIFIGHNTGGNSDGRPFLSLLPALPHLSP